MDTLAVYLAPEFIVDNLKLRLTQIPDYIDRDEDAQEWAVAWINKNYPVLRQATADGSNTGSFTVRETTEDGENVKYGWHLITIGKEQR